MSARRRSGLGAFSARGALVARATVAALGALALALGWLLLHAAPAAAQQPAPQALSAAVEPLVLSPEPGERVLQDGVLIAVSFIDRDAQLDPTTIRVELDGRDVTAEAELSAEVATWRPRQPLEAGPHRASLTARDRAGNTVGPIAWAFTVAPGFERTPAGGQIQPMSTAFTRFQGSITLEGRGRSISGPGAPLLVDEKQLPRLWMNAGGLISGSWRYSARVHVSGYESDERQPVNRFRFDLRSSHVNLGAGDVNPILHDLMLSGTRVRGVEGDLRAGPVRLTVVKGQTRRGILGLTDNAATQILRPGTYEQNLLAVRPALGTDAFQLGLTAMRVTDDTASIAELRVSNGVNAGTRRVNPTPKDNLVIGTDLTVRMLSGRILLQYAGAGSLLANDITGGALSRAELDELTRSAGADEIPFDPSQWDDWFIINQSLTPLDPFGGTNQSHLASASVRAGTNILSAEWRSIGGAYYSLGYPALLRDRRGIRVRDSFTAARGALALSAGFETDQDNLAETKPATTTNTGVFAQASWQASPTAVALVGSVRQGTRSNDLSQGQPGALDESSNAVSVGVGVPVGDIAGYLTRLNLNVTAIERVDAANPAVDSQDRYFVAGVEGASDNQADRFNLTYGLNSTELTSVATSKTTFHRVAGNLRLLVAPRWAATLDGVYTTASTPDAAANLAWGLRYNRRELLGGGQFEWTESSFVTVTAGLVQYADELVPGRDTREIVTRLTVHRSF